MFVRRMQRLILALFIGLLVIGGVAGQVWAQTCDRTGDVALMGNQLIVESGEVFCGDIALMGGRLIVEEGATVRGDVAIAGGNAQIDGTVDGEIAVFGGSLALGEQALVTGDVAVAGGTLEQAEGARIEGRIGQADINLGWRGLNTFTLPLGFIEGTLVRERGPFDWFLKGVWFIARFIITLIVMGTLAFIVALIAPRALRQTEQTIEQAPLQSFAVGCLSWMAALMLAILFAITIIGIPVTLLIVVALVATGIFSIIAVGALVGEQLLVHLNLSKPRLTTAAVVGVLLYQLLKTLSELVPLMGGFLGLTLTAIFVSLGTGAIILNQSRQGRGGGWLKNLLPSPDHPSPAADKTPEPPPSEEPPDPLDALFEDLGKEEGGTDEETRNGESGTQS